MKVFERKRENVKKIEDETVPSLLARIKKEGTEKRKSAVQHFFRYILFLKVISDLKKTLREPF